MVFAREKRWGVEVVLAASSYVISPSTSTLERLHAHVHHESIDFLWATVF